MKKNFWLGAYTLDFMREFYWDISRSSKGDNPNFDKNEGIDYKNRLHALLYELEKMAQFIRRKQKHFIVLLINSQEERGDFSEAETQYNRVVMIKCLELNLTCVDVLPKLISNSKGEPVFRFENDGHWSPSAHDLASKEIARAIMSWLAINDR